MKLLEMVLLKACRSLGPEICVNMDCFRCPLAGGSVSARQEVMRRLDDTPEPAQTCFRKALVRAIDKELKKGKARRNAAP